jgi:hypothetical protein
MQKKRIPEEVQDKTEENIEQQANNLARRGQGSECHMAQASGTQGTEKQKAPRGPVQV